MKTRQQYEDEAIGHGVAEDNCIGYSTQRQRFREGWEAAAKELGCGEYGTPMAADPWDDFRREAALEMLRQRGKFVGDVVSFIIEDVNRLVEGLMHGDIHGKESQQIVER